MTPEAGEQLVGAYLKLELACDFVDFNVRTPGGGRRGLEELDVVGLRFRDRTAYICEVATHIGGLNYGDYAETLRRVARKYARQQAYAADYLDAFPTVHHMFWAPVVPVGALTRGLAENEGLQLVVNADYKARVDALRDRARREQQDTGNTVFRVLQILAALRD